MATIDLRHIVIFHFTQTYATYSAEVGSLNNTTSPLTKPSVTHKIIQWGTESWLFRKTLLPKQ